ncbi:collagen alpha-1(I) chain-like [Dipodomys spectabilis]|uniref:collagen alpha-1(I) chain-like n=1 Tax=Dipodomys spectabilis TaxID=105255 RepID=UPI001C54390F|nr:collagen alpha-1(I) chain-like [Dipodomys spectabilis]
MRPNRHHPGRRRGHTGASRPPRGDERREERARRGQGKPVGPGGRAPHRTQARGHRITDNPACRPGGHGSRRRAHDGRGGAPGPLSPPGGGAPTVHGPAGQPAGSRVAHTRVAGKPGATHTTQRTPHGHGGVFSPTSPQKPARIHSLARTRGPSAQRPRAAADRRCRQGVGGPRRRPVGDKSPANGGGRRRRQGPREAGDTKPNARELPLTTRTTAGTERTGPGTGTGVRAGHAAATRRESTTPRIRDRGGDEATRPRDGGRRCDAPSDGQLPSEGRTREFSPPSPPWRTGGPAGRNPRREQNRSGKTLQKPPPPRRRASPTPGEQPHELSAVPPPHENTNTTPDSTVRRWPATRPNQRGSRKADAGEEGTPEAQEQQREGHRVGSPGREASKRTRDLTTPNSGAVPRNAWDTEPADQRTGNPHRGSGGPPKRGPRGKRQLSHTPQRPRERPRSRPRQQGPTASIHTTPPGTAPIIDRLFFGRVSKGPHTPGSSAPGGQNPPERRTTTGTAAPEHRGAQRPHGAVVANRRRPTQTLGNSVARGRRGRGTGPPKTPRQPKHEAGKPHTTRPRIATRHGLQAPPLDTPHARQGRGRIGNVLHSPHQTTARESRDVNLNGNFSLAQKPHEPEDGRDTPRAAGWHKAADNARIGNDTTTQPQAPERTNRERSGSTARGQSARRGFSHYTARASTEHRPSLSAERADPRADNKSREERSKIRAPPSSSVYKSPTSRRGQGERSRARLPHPRLPAHHRRRHGGTGEGRGPRAEREERSHSP